MHFWKTSIKLNSLMGRCRVDKFFGWGDWRTLTYSVTSYCIVSRRILMYTSSCFIIYSQFCSHRSKEFGMHSFTGNKSKFMRLMLLMRTDGMCDRYILYILNMILPLRIYTYFMTENGLFS